MKIDLTRMTDFKNMNFIAANRLAIEINVWSI